MERVVVAVILGVCLAWGLRALSQHVATLGRARDLMRDYRHGDAAARAELERQAHAKRELRERMRPDSAARWMIPLLMVALLVLILWRD